MSKKSKIALYIVAAAFIDAFASRYIDTALSYPFPIDVFLLFLSALILFFIAYKAVDDILKK